MAPKKATTKAPVQAKLNFTSTKAGATPTGKQAKALATSGSKAKAPSTSSQLIIPDEETPAVVTTTKPNKRAPANSDTESEPDDSDDNDDIEEVRVSDPEVKEVEHGVPDSDTESAVADPAPSTKLEEPEPEPEVHEISDDEDTPGPVEVKSLKQLLRDNEFKAAHKEALKDAGGELLGDAKSERKGEGKAFTILRNFDLNYDYGPCIGFTRMERWERAQKLGKNPPEIVRRILDSEKAGDLSDEDVERLRNQVFHNMV